jgi:hypothetical protein
MVVDLPHLWILSVERQSARSLDFKPEMGFFFGPRSALMAAAFESNTLDRFSNPTSMHLHQGPETGRKRQLARICANSWSLSRLSHQPQRYDQLCAYLLGPFAGSVLSVDDPSVP